MRRGLFLAALACAAPARAFVSPELPAPVEAVRTPAHAAVLTEGERATYRQAFAALRTHDYAAVATFLDTLPTGTLTPVARAELYLGRGAPRPAASALVALLTAAPDLPEAPALARLAQAQGATALPALPSAQPLRRMAGASKREMARAVRSDAAGQRLAAQVQPLLRASDVAGAEALIESAASQLSPEALAEWRARAAWGWFQAGDDAAARRVAALAQDGAGSWAVQGAWVAGLAAFRAADYAAAAAAFDRVAARGEDNETVAAGLYWAARGDTAGGRPDRVMARLRSASRSGETFYGMLASAQLGAAAPAIAPVATSDAALLRHADIRAAAALVEIGEPALADLLIRQQARIGVPAEHGALIAFAAALGLPDTGIWLAQNAPQGAASSPLVRFPMPGWTPSGGWRVDRALLLAHALQESQFRLDAVSRAGARGLMQLMPATARLVARHKGDPADAADRLGDPALSLEYGQTYLEELAGHWATGGLLPKVIAAYNAGPNNVAAWSPTPALRNDPLLFIEAIPFAETRAYVTIVLRNYWMYQREAGVAAPSLATLAQGKWPRFPGMARPIAQTAATDPATGGTGR